MNEEIAATISYSITLSKEEAVKQALKLLPCDPSTWRELRESKNKRQVLGVVECDARYHAAHPCGASGYGDGFQIDWEPSGDA